MLHLPQRQIRNNDIHHTCVRNIEYYKCNVLQTNAMSGALFEAEESLINNT